LSYRRAYAAFTILNLLFLWLSFRLLRPHMGNLAALWRWLPAAMFITFLPVAAALMQGQDPSCCCCCSPLLGLPWTSHAKDGRAANRVGFIQISNCAAHCLCFADLAAVALPLRLYSRRAGRWATSFSLAGMSQAPVYARSLVSMSVALSSQADQFRYGISPVSMANLRGHPLGCCKHT